MEVARGLLEVTTADQAALRAQFLIMVLYLLSQLEVAEAVQALQAASVAEDQAVNLPAR